MKLYNPYTQTPVEVPQESVQRFLDAGYLTTSPKAKGTTASSPKKPTSPKKPKKRTSPKGAK